MPYFHPDHLTYSLQAAALTDIGSLRRSNQDEVICCPELGFFAVCDGMGGLACGGEASRYVKEKVPGLVCQSLKAYARDQDLPKAVHDLSSRIQRLSDDLYRDENEGYLRSRYGTTLCAVWLLEDKAAFLNLGDSRGYLLPRKTGPLIQVTEDQNCAWPYIQNGTLTREEALKDVRSNRLTAFFGMKAPAALQVHMADIQEGMYLLLCSDGLYSMVPEADLSRLLTEEEDLAFTCQKLVSQANLHGGHDNIGLVCLQILGS